MNAGWKYFDSFQQAAIYFARFAQIKLRIPVLAIGGDKVNGEGLARQARLVADDASTVIIEDSGHWVLEEQPKQTTDALLRFL